MKAFYNLSISNKLIVIIMSTTIFILLINFTFDSLYEKNIHENNFKNKFLMQAKLMGEYSISPLVFNDSKGIEDILIKLESIPSVKNGIVYTQEKIIFAEYHKDKPHTPEMKKIYTHKWSSDYLEIISPIKYNNNLYGYIYLRISTNEMKSHLFQLLLTT